MVSFLGLYHHQTGSIALKHSLPRISQNAQLVETPECGLFAIFSLFSNEVNCKNTYKMKYNIYIFCNKKTFPHKGLNRIVTLEKNKTTKALQKK